MAKGHPVIWWVRRDLRLADNRTLHAAAGLGGPVIPLFIWDDLTTALGAAPKWRLGEGLAVLGETLARKGSRLVLRRGQALPELRAMVAETGAKAVYWSRLYTPDTQARDRDVKAALKEEGIDAQSFAGHLLFEPWTVQTRTGGYYKVYTPMWKAVRDAAIDAPQQEPARLAAPEHWPASLALGDLGAAAEMNRGAAIVARHANVGERARGRVWTISFPGQWQAISTVATSPR